RPGCSARPSTASRPSAWAWRGGASTTNASSRRPGPWPPEPPPRPAPLCAGSSRPCARFRRSAAPRRPSASSSRPSSGRCASPSSPSAWPPAASAEGLLDPLLAELLAPLAPLLGGEGVPDVVLPHPIDLEVALGQPLLTQAELL